MGSPVRPNGVNVKLFDPDPEAHAQGRRDACERPSRVDVVHDAPLPTEGTVTLVAMPEEAATGVQFVQESAPEKEGLKRALLAAASLPPHPRM